MPVDYAGRSWRIGLKAHVHGLRKLISDKHGKAAQRAADPG
jgi:hypothetical protein